MKTNLERNKVVQVKDGVRQIKEFLKLCFIVLV